MAKFTEEIKQQIFNDYQNRNIKVHDIYKKYKCYNSDLKSILCEYGAGMRAPQKMGKREKTKICSKCKKSNNIKGAKFCPYCGADLRSEKDLIVEKLEKIKDFFFYLPENEKDNYIKILCECIGYINLYGKD